MPHSLSGELVLSSFFNYYPAKGKMVCDDDPGMVAGIVWCIPIP
jgi:hypothetical protein